MPRYSFVMIEVCMLMRLNMDWVWCVGCFPFDECGGPPSGGFIMRVCPSWPGAEWRCFAWRGGLSRGLGRLYER